jgi:hypothetical protein
VNGNDNNHRHSSAKGKFATNRMTSLIKEMVYGMEQRAFLSEQQLMSVKLKIDSEGKDKTYIACKKCFKMLPHKI